MQWRIKTTLSIDKSDKKPIFCHFCQRLYSEIVTGMTLFLFFVNFVTKTIDLQALSSRN